MSQVTLGNCRVNSSDNLNGRSNPVSKYARSFTGSVPQLGAVEFVAVSGGELDEALAPAPAPTAATSTAMTPAMRSGRVPPNRPLR